MCLCRKRCAYATSWLSHLEIIYATRLGRLTSSPQQRHGVIYSSVQTCYHSAGTVQFMRYEGVYGHIHLKEGTVEKISCITVTITLPFSFKFLRFHLLTSHFCQYEANSNQHRFNFFNARRLFCK